MSYLYNLLAKRQQKDKLVPMVFRFLIVSLLFLFQIQLAYACRFNVRETGFVDLENEHYFLVGYINDQTPAGITKDFMDVSNSMLSGSNLKFELINLDKQKNHPAIQYLSKEGQAGFPKAILISPDGQSLKIEVEKTEQDFKKSLKERLSHILSSPFRKKLKNQLIDKYGVVLVIESSDRGANIQALKAAQDAVEKVTRKMDLMPKVIKKPPVLMVVKYQNRSAESILIWMLGLEEDKLSKPHAAIFYGRARWLGPLFRGEEITRNNLSEILFVVGADCECGLDKNWLRCTLLPMSWDKKAQKKITENLGFDPENPMIKIEVSRIMRTEHFIPGEGIPSPEILTNPHSGDTPRQGLTYDDDEGEIKNSNKKSESSQQQDGSILTKSVGITAGILSLLLIVGGAIIFRRSRRK